jgi:hypothetical protein
VPNEQSAREKARRDIASTTGAAVSVDSHGDSVYQMGPAPKAPQQSGESSNVVRNSLAESGPRPGLMAWTQAPKAQQQPQQQTAPQWQQPQLKELPRYQALPAGHRGPPTQGFLDAYADRKAVEHENKGALDWNKSLLSHTAAMRGHDMTGRGQDQQVKQWGAANQLARDNLNMVGEHFDKNFDYRETRDNVGDKQWGTTFDRGVLESNRTYDRGVVTSDRDYGMELGKAEQGSAKWMLNPENGQMELMQVKGISIDRETGMPADYAGMAAKDLDNLYASQQSSPPPAPAPVPVNPGPAPTTPSTRQSVSPQPSPTQQQQIPAQQAPAQQARQNLSEHPSRTAGVKTPQRPSRMSGNAVEGLTNIGRQVGGAMDSVSSRAQTARDQKQWETFARYPGLIKQNPQEYERLAKIFSSGRR